MAEATFPGQGDCSFVSATTVSCAHPRFRVGLIEGSDDTFNYVGGAPLPAVGIGQDLFTSSGGAGADVLTGSPMGDDLTGDGRDLNNGQPVSTPQATTRCFGNGGDDELHDNDGGSNRIEGGAGADRTYTRRAASRPTSSSEARGTTS